MAYVPKIFKDRAVEFPFRRLLTPVSGQANTVDVSRVPGTIFEVGDEPDAANLNAEFGKIKDETDAIITSLQIDYSKTIFDEDTELNVFLQGVAEKLFPPEIYIFNNGSVSGYSFLTSGATSLVSVSEVLRFQTIASGTAQIYLLTPLDLSGFNTINLVKTNNITALQSLTLNLGTMSKGKDILSVDIKGTNTLQSISIPTGYDLKNVFLSFEIVVSGGNNANCAIHSVKLTK